MGMMTELNEETFDAAVKSGVTLVDFWASWCGPCRMLMPVLEQLAGEWEGRAAFAKVNVEDAPQLAARFGVSNVPALFIFKDGNVVKEFVGMQSKSKLNDALTELS